MLLLWPEKALQLMFSLTIKYISRLFVWKPYCLAISDVTSHFRIHLLSEGAFIALLHRSETLKSVALLNFQSQ